ncbi:MAG: CHAD domain-containing protein [Gemmatimonadaceae bacterium]|nr:CHAD domain-containing protein [Gemmatimonadaceae bacterium]
MPTRIHPPLPPADTLLTSPAPLAARLLCRQYAFEAKTAETQIEADGDAGVAGRHHFRVALRRLRVTLDAYRVVLADTVPDKLSRRAQSLARRLGPARDRDVQLQLMAAVSNSRTARQRQALARLALIEDGAATGVDDAATIRHRWHRLSKSLHESLGSWHEQHRLDGPRQTMPFAFVAADALEHAAERVARRCAAIADPAEPEAIHAARLALKSARYLLAPLADGVPDGRAMMKVLRDVQDQLGALREATALHAHLTDALTIQPDAPPLSTSTLSALDASQRDLDARMTTASDAFAPWRDPQVRHGFIARLHAIAAEWRTTSTLPVEIERKWLLSALPPRVRGLIPSDLHQGYLPGDALIERIRSVTRGTVTAWIRTVKLGRGISRIEVEEPATAALGEALFALTTGKRVAKRRYAVDDGALTWEIDEFTDRALVLAEVELPREDTAIELPVWLAPYVVREVTNEPEFTNWQLAR